ncbi:MAG TPA: protein kinase [Burkholderiales bacterium]|jgi:serine/threonine-protein kinase|nr:protein kinase [Burkholderiales bacterium]
MPLPEYIGKYRVEGVLGQGGMGTVYRAFDPAIHRQVAIKTVNKGTLDPINLQYALMRFRHEAQAVGRLTHPRIAAIYDYGEDPDIAYIVMELVNGKSLFQHMQEQAHFALKEIGEVIRQLLDGLGYAHDQGVVHRDIKPSNLLVNADGRIKISDFGIARLDSSTLTQVGEIMGSPGYMAPEQFLGTEIDACSDIYSVGIIAYELLVGKRPFSGSNPEIMRAVLNDRPANPSMINPQISAQLDWAVHKSLAKEKSERFQSASEFSEAFLKGIEGSIRNTMPEPEPAALSEVTTQRIDTNLLQAARLLAGLPLEAPPMRPVPPPDATPQPTPAPTEDTSKKPRIVFIDDEERILTALKSVFRANYHVFTATDGAQALDFIKKFGVHVVVSDQRMPGMTGVQVLRQLKEVAPNTVRILLTGYSDLASIVGSINEGEVFRFVSKPWNNQEIQKIVGDAVAIAMELQEAAAAPVATTGKMSAGTMVIDPKDDIFRSVHHLFAATCPVLHAGDLDEAFKILADQEIALIVADIESARDEAIATFKLLKQDHPEILAIVLTEASDSELVIELINQAQIFRFLNKPVNMKLLTQHVQSALERYQSFKQSPQLVQQHKVATASITETLADGIRSRIGALKSWLRPVIR